MPNQQDQQAPSVPASVPLRYTRDTKRLYCRGVDFNDPVDSVKDGHYPILENLRSYTDGIIQPRLGITQVVVTGGGIVTSKTPVHSIKRLNNPLNSTYTRILGVGDALANGQATFAQLQYNASNLVMSGKPLAMVPWRPTQSPVSWMYIADSSITTAGGATLGLIKLTYDGSTTTVHQVGIAPPSNAPSVELGSPKLSGEYISSILGSIFATATLPTTRWSSDGTVVPTSPAAGSQVYAARVAAGTVTQILWDVGTTGWGSVIPASMTDIGVGSILITTTGGVTSYHMVYETYRAGAITGNTINQILYDIGTSGLCTITPTASIPEIKRNAIVLLNAVGSPPGTYVRVIETIYGPDNSVIAFRCTTGATTLSATQSLSIVNSLRVYDGLGSITTATTFVIDSVTATFTASGTSVGQLIYTPAVALDFTQQSTFGVIDLDYLHYSIKVADLSKIIQGRIIFNVDSTDVGNATVSKNYYYRVFTPSDLVTLAKGTQTVLNTTSTVVQNNVIVLPRIGNYSGPSPLTSVTNPMNTGNNRDPLNQIGPQDNPYNIPDNVVGPPPSTTPVDENPTDPRDQTGTGDSQWSELIFRRGDCIRVGTDWSKGWQSVVEIRFEITPVAGAIANIIAFSSLNCFGGDSPDVGDIGAPYIYRYRYRSSLTGVASNWSPATREGVLSRRTKINVKVASPTNLPTAELDKIDIQRWGGLVTQWANIGSRNPGGSGTFVTYIDTTSDDGAFSTTSMSVGDINFQPWLIPQLPITGTTGVVAGTLVQDSGTTFNTKWVKGTAIKIGTYFTFIRRVISTSLLEVEDCIGAAASGLVWEIQQPFLAAQSLPCLFGPLTDGWFFACGDTVNPGRLYYCNQNNPDSTQDAYWLEVTGPSEPLQNGLVYNGRCYVFTPERMFEIVEIGTGQFVPREVPTGKGLLYRWAFAVGPRVWFLAKDGIYETDGGIARSITFDTLFPIFPKEGKLGTTTNGFYAPNMVEGDITVSGLTTSASRFFRMAYYDDYLYFDYPDTNNKMRTLVYGIGNFSFVYSGTPQSGWFPDAYVVGDSTNGILCHYGEEGDKVHNLLLGGLDTTTGKLYSYGGTTDNGTPFTWHFRQGSFDAGDRRADKIWADFVVDANPGAGTINVAAAVNNYLTAATLNTTTITGAGRQQKTFDITTGDGIEGRNFAVDLSGTGTDALLYLIEPSFTQRPENSFLRATQYDDAGYQGEKFFQGIEIEANTYNVARTIPIQSDGGTLQDTLTINHNGRIQKPYSFASGFVAHMVRMAPSDSALWKLFKWRWISEPEPPLVTVWDTQQTSFGHVGFVHLRAIWITHTSTANLTLTITRMDDNTTQAFTIPHSAGVRGKETYLPLGPASFCKGKTYKFKITQVDNVPYRIYQRNCGVLIKPWGSGQEFARWVGWGADSGDGIAQI